MALNSPLSPTSAAVSIDSPLVRSAGRGLLSLALMDARNHTLYLLSHYEKALGAVQFQVPLLAELNPPLWELGHIGWFQEWWIARNMQRHRGVGCDPAATRLASIELRADGLWDASHVPHDNRWTLDSPDLGGIKTYLLNTLETNLELLEKAPDEDDALYFYRLALFHEDMHGEALVHMAQTLGLPLGMSMPGPVPVREPLQVPATRWQLGRAMGGGFTFDNERQAHEVQVPEFEIDAQVVTWAQFVAMVTAQGGQGRPARPPLCGPDQRGQRRGHANPLWNHPAHAGWPAGYARELVGGGCLVSLGRSALARRSGMGGGCTQCRASRHAMGRCLGMDRYHLQGLPRFFCRSVP
jgi:gamma-glutamyl hercynylcysteine S-oxide synthase